MFVLAPDMREFPGTLVPAAGLDVPARIGVLTLLLLGFFAGG